jgi:hypothetical protein
VAISAGHAQLGKVRLRTPAKARSQLQYRV